MTVTDREFENLQDAVEDLRKKYDELNGRVLKMTAWQSIAPWVSMIVIGLTGLGMVLSR